MEEEGFSRLAAAILLTAYQDAGQAGGPHQAEARAFLASIGARWLSEMLDLEGSAPARVASQLPEPLQPMLDLDC